VIRLAVRVRRAQAELVLAELLELAPEGVEEVAVDEGTVEYAVYGAPGELPSLPDLTGAVGDSLVEISTSETADDWQERWKRFHRPVVIEPAGPWADRPLNAGEVPALYVRTPWHAPSPREDVQEIVIDPGQAFGTGGHASTRLCLGLLLELAARERPTLPLVDLGTGSGVLAIAAARLGFSPVLGLDNDLESVDAARVNAAVNGVPMDVRLFDLREQALPWLDSPGGEPASIVLVANLLRPLLLELAHTMSRPPAHLIAAGLLKHEAQEILAAFGERLGLHARERVESGEWAAVWMSAQPS
jgi:ribosomal protein L11 methyltransferase